MIVFFFLTGKWTEGAPMPTKRGDFAMAYMNNLAVCAGGLGK